MNEKALARGAEWFLRVSLAVGLLSAVADRFGLWGPPGAPGVSWGAWEPFEAYCAKLNWYAPEVMVPVLAWVATIAEVVLAVGLVIGWRLREIAVASGLLLLSFAVTMVSAVGLKKPLDYSVFVAAAAAFYLAWTRPRSS